MSTDTAVLTTKLIIENKMTFDEIPFVDDPEIHHQSNDRIEESVQISGFRYVQNSFSWKEGKFLQKEDLVKKPLMN